MSPHVIRNVQTTEIVLQQILKKTSEGSKIVQNLKNCMKNQFAAEVSPLERSSRNTSAAAQLVW